MKIFGILTLVILASSCQKKINISQPVSMNKTYLALGDSYTIGESVTRDQSFPYQLTAKLNLAGMKVSPPEIVATTGWTTDDLIKAIPQNNLQKKYDLVTLLIGVNNQYRGYSPDVYRREFKELLKTAINFAGGNKSHVFVVSIPDWGVTAFAQKSNRDIAKISEEIDLFNAINKDETLAENIQYIDITAGSRRAGSDDSLIATDGLHPSAKMYAEWAEMLGEQVLKATY
ncbi:SGNH/GDSL hydrolase family protein [Daejeonella oryzae]|uniref:SGNH/GDSL hydrolase family protein n=1 Tax=Daejeonella oryzae TaxID=1122943 RepID=UPI0003F9391D|nr:SGNH/GDSL hydrolase family protein [Daejeonella oryzae]